MTRQPSFSQTEFADKKKNTRREKFLTRMEAVILWPQLLAVLDPFYPKGQRGRPPVGLELMLRVYFLQQMVRPGGRSPRRRPLRQPGAAGLCPHGFGRRGRA